MPININKRSDVNSVNGKVGDVVLNASDIGALSKDTKIPTKTSDLINNSGFVTAAGRVANADLADRVKGTLTIQKNGTTIKTYDGSADVIANLSIPTKLTDLSGLDNIVMSNNNTVDDIRIISQASYDALDKSSIANNTVYLVY